MSILSNVDIETICHDLKIHLIGVFSKDHLPKIRQLGYYVVNMQNATDQYGNELEGSHWVLMGCFKNACYYFDSFGMPPPKQVISFLKSYDTILFNNVQIQDINSDICGWFCITCAYVLQNNKGPVLNRAHKFVSLFQTNLKRNNLIAETLVRRWLLD